MENSIGVIYKVVAKVTGEIYYGQTWQDPETRWKQHIAYSKREYKEWKNGGKEPCLFYKALVEYGGKNAFTWEIVDTALSQYTLDMKEIYYIAKDNTCHGVGLNSNEGGHGGKHNDVTRERMSHTRKGSDITRTWLGKTGAKHARSTQIKGTHFKTGHTLYFGSTCEAERKTGIALQNICKCLKGERELANDYSWVAITKEEYLLNRDKSTTFVQRKLFALVQGVIVGEYSGSREAEKDMRSKGVKASQSAISLCAMYHEDAEEYMKTHKKPRLSSGKIGGEPVVWKYEYVEVPFLEEQMNEAI